MDFKLQRSRSCGLKQGEIGVTRLNRCESLILEGG